MALDIGVGDGCSLIPVQGEPSLFLEDDGYYWFLHPLFERLAVETGQYIDLYGDGSFAGEKLAALERVLAEARQFVRSQPEAWSVHVGTQVSPERRELYRPVERQAMLALLDRWDVAIERARQLGRPIVCFGD
jgi:hypothetical protein